MWSDIIFSNVTALLIGCLVFLLFATQKRRGRNYPPGPTTWPVLGNLPQLGGNIIDSLDGLRKQYGDVYSVYMGNILTVCVHGLDSIKEVLVTRGDEFIDRPKLFLTEQITKGRGVLSSNGQVWKEQRRFTLHTLRDFGFGKTSLEGKVMEEVEDLIKRLEETHGLDFPIGTLINTSVSNVICSIIYGSRSEHDDPQFKEFFRLISENVAASGMSSLNFLPFLRYVPGDFFHGQKLLENTDRVEVFIKQQIEEHKKSFDPNNLRDFIDGYLAEMAQHTGTDSSFCEEQLVMVVGDLFVAGTETTSTTLSWSLFYLMHNPEIQIKIREEIHRVVGKSRLPSMADRKHMPYVEASLMEIQRCSDVAFSSVPRTAVEDTTLNGYFIPKGAVIMNMLTSLHKDPNVWKDPESFDPSRFLDSDMKIVKRDHYLPFSAGKRVCPGESLAKMELFLFLTTMLQRFVFKLPEGVTSLPMEPNLGITRSPIPFKLKAVLDV